MNIQMITTWLANSEINLDPQENRGNDRESKEMKMMTMITVIIMMVKTAMKSWSIVNRYLNRHN